MVDLADKADNVVNFEQEKRHGLAHLARFHNARKRGSDYISPETLKYFEELAGAFLKAAASNKSGAIRNVVNNRELGLTYSTKGRPKKIIGPHTNVKKDVKYWVALHRAKLVVSGKSATEADELTREEFDYEDARDVRAATKMFKEHVDEAIELQRLVNELKK